MAIEQNISSEIGDVILIKGNIPLIGLISFTAFADTLIGETGSKFFTKEFRYSLDGINFTTFQELTVPNITAISVNPTDFFFIEYKYTRAGTDASGTLRFIDNTLSAVFADLVCGPTYEKSIFNQFFSCFDQKILLWCLNVLEKTYKPGIIPKYITRDKNGNVNRIDEDFLAVWKAVTCFFAIIVQYARIFQDFSTFDRILKEYLIQKGLFICLDQNTEELLFLMKNYYRAINERGTKGVITKKLDKRQISTHTLTGTSGTANITINGTDYLAEFTTDLSGTATKFLSDHTSDILGEQQVVVTKSGADIILTSAVGGLEFTTVSANVTGDLDSIIVATQLNEHILTNGELLRLICFRIECDEFLFTLTDEEKFGWNIGNSSPLYKGTSFQSQLIKGYENTKDLKDLTKYPIDNSAFVSIDLADNKSGVELVTNGEFTTNLSGWVVKNVVQAAGKADYVGASGFQRIKQNIVVEEAKEYVINLDVSSYSSGTLEVFLEGTLLLSITANGSFKVTFRATTDLTPEVIFRSLDNGVFKVDNVSTRLNEEVDVFKIDAVPATEEAGIGPDPASLGAIDFPNHAIIVDPSLDYEITFLVKQEDITDKIKLDIFSFDKTNLEVKLKSVIDGVDATEVFFDLSLNQASQYYFVRAIIYNVNQVNLSAADALPNIGVGKHLRFQSGIVKIVPRLVVDNSAGGSPSDILRIYDFKVRPLNTQYSTGFIQSKNLVQIWAKNNDTELSEVQVEDTIRKFLIPYNTNLKINFLPLAS